MKKMDYRRAEKIYYGLLIGAVVCMLLGLWMKEAALLFTGLIAIIGSMLFGVLFIHCPHCGMSLTHGRLQFPMGGDYCPYCGKKLTEDQNEE